MKLIYSTFFVISFFSSTLFSQNVVVVLIDGARYTETFGDPYRTYIPKMNIIAQEGTYCDAMYNNYYTYTSKAVPALWTGEWSGSDYVNFNGNDTQATKEPSIFEYFRKQKSIPAEKCYHSLAYVSSLWLQSFHTEYGQDYWPTTISSGSTDSDVLTNTLTIMDDHHPQLLWVYLSDVDHQGHTGVWSNYVTAIETADDIVNSIWEKIQTDNFYKNNTTLLVTNDHGRHTTDFSGHGDGCDGCRHIMMLAVGPDIKENYVSTDLHETADFATTIAEILDVNPEYSTGELMSDIFKSNTVKDNANTSKLKVINNQISFNLDESSHIKLEIFNIQGKLINSVINKDLSSGNHIVNFSNLPKGFYILKMKNNDMVETLKFLE